MQKLLTEYVYFLRHCVPWWLVPYAVLILGIAAMAWMHDALPSFIYPIF